jgi:hypothetical protein
MKSLFREPLVHFLIIGAGLFLAFGLTRESGVDNQKLIQVSPGQVEQLTAQFKRARQRTPSKKEIAALVESYVRDEIYYREALAMGLDRNDPQVRLRMRMKLEFLLEDLTADEAPDEKVLSAFLQEHADKFLVEPQVSFQQVYLDPDKHQDFDAEAKKILADLNKGAAPESAGDRTLLQYEYRLAIKTDITRSFGEEFADDVVQQTPGDWTGPLYSRFGVHLVKVSERVEGRLPELSEVRDQVEREYTAERRKELKDLAYQSLRKRYEIVVAPQDTAGKAGEAVAATLSQEAGQ